MRIAHLNASLGSLGYHDPKKMPKSADDLLDDKDHGPAYTKDQWRGLAAALMQQYSDKPVKKKKRKT